MVQRLWLILMSLVFLHLIACKRNEGFVEQFAQNQGHYLDKDTLRHHIKSIFGGNAGWGPCASDFKHISVLMHHYGSSDFKSSFTLNWGHDSWDSLLNLMDEMATQGLDPRMYHSGRIRFLLDSLNHLNHQNVPYKILSELELLASNALVEMYHDLSWGRTDPKVIFGRYYHIPLPEKNEQHLSELLRSENPFEQIRKLEIKDRENELLAAEIKNIKNALYYHGEPPKIDLKGRTRLDPGHAFENFGSIAQRMLLMGWIDSTAYLLGDSNFYPRSFTPVLQSFQRNLALADDGVIGGNTLEALNRSRSDLITELMANFERKRWVKHLIETPMIVVNIPEYAARLHSPDSVWWMKVCVGKSRSWQYDALLKEFIKGNLASKPPNHETPQIYAKVNHMVLNPTWTVPFSIVKNEMLPKMRTDKDYLKRNNYVVLYQGKLVNSDYITWNESNAARYTIRQEPGPHNALGKIKFMFVNPFSVYMHDTPNQRAFGNSSRDVSHGCVRLERPLDMAHFLCAANPNLNIDDVRIMLGFPPFNEARLSTYDPMDTTAKVRFTEDPRVVHLRNQVPLLFDYRTVFVDEQGILQFRFDSYRKQKLLAKTLDF